MHYFLSIQWNVSTMKSISRTVLLVLLFAGFEIAIADPIPCRAVSDTVNYMQIDDSQVSACFDSGVGNINGNTNGRNPDPFLSGLGLGYELIGKTDDANPFNLFYTQSKTETGSTGTWEFDAEAWQSWEKLAIGFKFGTGNTADEWFVYNLADMVRSGNWDFFEFTLKGGQGLSHANLYGMEKISVPEPGTLALLGAGLILIAARGRRRKVQ